MNPIHIAVIGCGRMGKMHIDNIRNTLPHVQIKSIVENTPDRSWLRDKGLEHTLTPLEKALEDKSIEAVIIAASSASHVALIEQAAQAGKHIFCEKPIAFTLEGIQSAIDVVHKNQVKMQVGFNRRFDPTFAKLKQGIERGDIGDIHLVKITNRDPKRPDLSFIPRSGGLFLDFNVHDFDTLRFITGLEVKKIQAFGSNLVDPKIGELNDIDTCTINCMLEGGQLATIDASREAVYGYDQRIEVLGNKGALHADNQPQTSLVGYHATTSRFDTLKYSFVERYKEAYQLQIMAFFDYLQSDRPSPVCAKDTLQAVALAMAAQRSYQENRIVDMTEIL